MFKGSMVAIVTPMQKGGSVDFVALDKLIDMHLENATDGIVSMGTTGESATLSHDEHIDVVEHTVKKVGGQVPVIAGTGSNSTSEAIELTERAAAIGADAALLVTPYYNKPTQEGLIKHFQTIAAAVNIPQILYNVPSRTAVDMLPETVEKLSMTENIVGIKDATGDLDRLAAMVHLSDGGKFCLLSGDDLTSREFLLAGGHGVISVTANCTPSLMAKLCQACRNRDIDLAKTLDDKMIKLHRDLFVEANPIPVKWCLTKMGLIQDELRLPLTTLSSEFHSTLIAAMVHAEIINGS